MMSGSWRELAFAMMRAGRPCFARSASPWMRSNRRGFIAVGAGTRRWKRRSFERPVTALKKSDASFPYSGLQVR